MVELVYIVVGLICACSALSGVYLGWWIARVTQKTEYVPLIKPVAKAQGCPAKVDDAGYEDSAY